MKHEQSEILKAYADNKALVIFVNNEGDWVRTNPRVLIDHASGEFFACLPKHKEACLHWLNGGEVQTGRDCSDLGWDALLPFEGKWNKVSHFMCVDILLRIKPKKEKRWIAVDPSTTQCTRHYSTKESCFNSEFSGCDGNSSGWQFIEIEVEV